MSYVKIFDRCHRRHHRFELPVTFGSSRLCDIIVNAANIPALSLMLDTGSDDTLELKDVPRNCPADMSRLKALGLTVTGPISGSLAPSPSQTFVEFAAAEKAYFRRLPQPLQLLLGGKLSQAIRLATWFALPAIILGALFLNSRRPATPSDWANKKIPLTPGTVLIDSIGAVPGYPAFRHGFTLTFTPNDSLAAHAAAVIYFDAKDLDQAGELKLSLNGREIWTSVASPECLNRFCQTAIALPAGLVTAGENALTAQHANADSSYLIKNILLTATTTPTPQRRAQIALVYERAQRAYDERAIVLQNLVTSKQELDHLDQLLIGSDGSDGVDEVRRNAARLRQAVHDEFEATSKNLLFNAERAEQLGHLDQAERQFKDLLSLYPQADDKTHLSIQKRLVALKEMQK